VGTATGFSPWIVQSKLDVVDAHSQLHRCHARPICRGVSAAAA
jgi:hypothetical protein